MRIGPFWAERIKAHNAKHFTQWASITVGVGRFRIKATTAPPLFSERMGYTRSLRIGKWRVRLLTRWTQ